jgi:hypothetical protein
MIKLTERATSRLTFGCIRTSERREGSSYEARQAQDGLAKDPAWAELIAHPSYHGPADGPQHHRCCRSLIRQVINNKRPPVHAGGFFSFHQPQPVALLKPFNGECQIPAGPARQSIGLLFRRHHAAPTHGIRRESGQPHAALKLVTPDPSSIPRQFRLLDKDLGCS